MSKAYYSGFCQINPFSTSAYQHQLGVLNNKGLSYAKAPQVYYKNAELLELVIFRGVQGTVQDATIPSTHSGPILEVLSWMYNQAIASKFTSNAQSTLQLLVTQFSNYTFNSIGEMKTNGKVYLPSHIDVAITVNSVEHEFKIWFALENFLVEFPYRDIYVFGPVPPTEIDILLSSNYKELTARFAEETAAKLEARIQKVIGDNVVPYTWRNVLSYDIYDLINTPQTTKGDWTIILWGNPLDAEDAINEAIKDCILANSKKSESDWEPVVPDIFNPLEFFLIPHWDNVGLVNATTKGSTYSPITAFLNGDTLAQKYADFYDSSFIKSSLQFVPHNYKSLGISVVGKPKNNLNQTTFSSVYPDYQIIPASDSQVGMMSEVTAEAVERLETILSSAEVATDSAILAAGVNKVTRKDRLYVSLKVGKVKFTCITRSQFIKDGLIEDE